MDSITQAALGAAVGEGLLGRKIGNRAPLWGAVLGTLPDLDVFLNFLFDPVGQLSWHRGPSHSVLFAAVAAPLLALAFGRLHRSWPVSWREWSLLAFLCIVTHPLLDALTNYGTQLFWPFTDYPVAWASVAIVDPLYTLPLLVSVIVAMFLRRDSTSRRRWSRIGLVVSTGYLALTAVNKLYVESVFTDALGEQAIPYESFTSTPTVFQNLLWAGLAENDSSVWVGLYSVLDDEPDVRFRRFDKNAELLAPHSTDRAVRKLLWFSQGYYRTFIRADTLWFDDLHVGARDAFMGDSLMPIFRFHLVRDTADPERFTSFAPEEIAFDVDGRLLEQFRDRILGVSRVRPDGASRGDSVRRGGGSDRF